MNAVAAASNITKRQDDLQRIAEALRSVSSFVSSIDCQRVDVTHCPRRGPTTSVDREINDILCAILPRRDEGWLSEESADDHKRLQCERVWIVDPLDGTREFLSGIPEWCVSIGLVENGRAVAGGILDPSSGEIFLGSKETGFTVSNTECSNDNAFATESGCVLISRREHNQGKWQRFEQSAVKLKPAGSIAYRLAHVAAQRASATCTFEPRHEWDIAGGVALVQAASGAVFALREDLLTFNRSNPLLKGLVAFSSSCPEQISSLLRGEIA